MNKEIKEILELTIQFVEEELDKGTPKKDIINAYSTQVREAFNHIKGYITNLQEDLKYQKEMYDEYCDKHTKLMQEYSNLKKENEILNKGIEYAKRIEKDYKTRFDKAIEDIGKLINGDYEEVNGDSAKYYQIPRDCCIERLEVVKKDLLGSDSK